MMNFAYVFLIFLMCPEVLWAENPPLMRNIQKHYWHPQGMQAPHIRQNNLVLIARAILAIVFSEVLIAHATCAYVHSILSGDEISLQKPIVWEE